MGGELHDILFPGPKRGHGQNLESQAVQKVGPEIPFFGQARQVDIGRPYDPAIDVEGLGSPDALEFAVFDDP